MRYLIWSLVPQLFIQALILAHLINPSFAVNERSKINTSNTTDTKICQGKLQKRGQCLSSLRPNPTRNRNNRRNDRHGPRAAQQSSSLTHGQLPSGQPSELGTIPQQAPTDRSRNPVAVLPPTVVQPPVRELAHQSKLPARQRDLASLPQSTRPPLRRTLSMINPTRLESQSRPILPKVQSAPVLSDMLSVKKHFMAVEAANAAERKAKSMRKTTVNLEQKTRASVAAVTGTYPSYLQGVHEVEEKIRRQHQVVTETRALARQLKRQAMSYSETAKASQAATDQTRADRNRKKAEWSTATSDTWKSVSKTYSYSAQAERTRLKDRAERERIQSAPDPRRLALHGSIQPLLRIHDLQSEYRQRELAMKRRDASSLVQDNSRRATQLGEAGGYESDEMQPAQGNIPGAQGRRENLPVRPFTPSPASSRGRSDTDERQRRISDSSSKPE